MRISGQITALFMISSLGLMSCQSPLSKNDAGTTNASVATTTTGRYLYVVSGTCYAGGVATSTPSNIVVKYDIKTGSRLGVIADYRYMVPGDSPISITGYDNDDVLISVENANSRRIDEVRKNGMGTIPFLVNATAFTTALKNIVTTADGSYMITRAAAVERFTSFRTRYLNSGNPYINNPTPAACAAMNTALTFSLELPNGNVVIGSAAATPNNKIASLSGTGYNVVGDCLSSKAAPTTTALPTAAVNVATDTILVSYASTAAVDNQVVAYKYTSSNLGTATTKAVLNNPSYLFGASSMVFDSTTSALYIANAPAGGERIEKYIWDNTAQTLTRAGTAPFIQSADLTCVSGMYIGN